MSSLIFHTDKQQVFVATDTLATSYDGKPFMFTTKAFIIPHLRMIICGTGAGGFLGRWFIQVNNRMVVRGIDNLDYHASKILLSIWHSYKEEFSIPEKVTTTIYHFGFSEEDDLIHSYVYRSAENFKSESRQYGIGFKPECQILEGYEFPRDIKKMMEEQRTIQLLLPKNERVYIGGEIQIHHLTKSGFSIYTLDQFEDYAKDEQMIYKNYHS